MKDILISTIGKQLNIPQMTDSNGICRAIYSLAGKMALASLWDRTEDEDSVSIQHFKRRIEEIYEAYAAIYPEVNGKLPSDKSVLSKEIYKIYQRTGHFYHSAHRLAPAAHVTSSNDSITLHRGAAPNAEFFMSGLGFYAGHSKPVSDLDVGTMFELQAQPLNVYLQELLNGGGWSAAECPVSAEFLRMEPPFWTGEWIASPYTDGRISLARYGEPQKLYILYRCEGGQMFQRAIPAWRTTDFRSDNSNKNDGEYRRIAVSLLEGRGTLPPIKVKITGTVATVHLGYRLPPTEEDFFKLYSWPTDYSKPFHIFTREMAVPIYMLFRKQMEPLGYQFEEN